MGPRGKVLPMAAAAIVAAACVREPSFTPRDGGGDPDAGDAAVPVCPSGATNVAVTANGGGVRVCGPRYRVEFSERGAHFPDQLFVDGTQLLANGERCNDERGIGVALYPSLLINGETAPQVTGTIAIDLGSATAPIAKVGIDWQADYTCDTTMAGALGARSTFTFFPDGRVSRYDRIAHPATVSAGSCTTCEASTAGSPFYLTSFTTLVADASARVDDAGGDASMLDGAYGASIAGSADVCVETQQRNVALGWRTLSGAVSSRVRIARAWTGQAGALAFVFDQLAAAAEIEPASAYALLRTTMILGEPACSSALARVRELAAPRPIRITYGGGSFENLIANLDGIYGGEDETRLPGHQVLNAPQPMTLTIPAGGQAVTEGFAVWLDLGAFFGTIDVSSSARPGGSTDWYGLQRATAPSNGVASQIVLWFPDGLALGETLTIDAGP